LNKNLIVIYDQRIRLVSYSFREFIISRDNTDDEKKLLVKMKSGGSWDFVRFIVVVLIISVFIFLFLTRQEVSTKIIGLLTSLSVVLPLIFKLGSSTAPAGAEKK
jgi:Na+/H+ antiporter NhaC